MLFKLFRFLICGSKNAILESEYGNQENVIIVTDSGDQEYDYTKLNDESLIPNIVPPSIPKQDPTLF